MGKTMHILNMMEKYMFSLKFLRESPWKKIHLVSLKLRRKGKDSYIFLTNNASIYS